MIDPAPLILTLRMDDAHQAFFDQLRAAHFPPERNFLKAHATLFHALPGDAFEEIADALAERVAIIPAPSVLVAKPYSLGRGVAYRLDSPDALVLRRSLASGWTDRLTPQDRSFSGVHVTVQNKVAPEAARALLADLAENFRPSAFVSPGLDLWRYRDGPWEAAGRFAFAR